MMSVLSGLFQILEKPSTSPLLSLSSIISGRCCLSKSSLHRTSNWIRGALSLFSKSCNSSMILGQTMSTQNDCMLFLRLGKSGGHVTPKKRNGSTGAQPVKGVTNQREFFEIKRTTTLERRCYVERFLRGFPGHCGDN